MKASWVLIVVTGAVVVSFLTAHLWSRSRARELDGYALDIATDEAPSIQHLAAVQEQLSQMQASAALALHEVREGRHADWSFFAGNDAMLHAELAQYLAFPADPGEREAYRAMDESIDAFERAVEQQAALAERGDLEGAVEISRTLVRPRHRQANRAIRDLIALNANIIEDVSRRLMAARRNVTAFAGVLHALAALLALALMGLAARILRERARLERDRQRVTEERAEELERFALRVAHDLKGPLSALSLRTAMLQPPVHDKMAQQIRSMSEMIDGLLAFAIAGGSPGPGRAELDAVLDEVATSIRDEAARAGADLALDEIPPLVLVCSRGELVSVLSNLLRNAVKYIGEGSGDRHIRVRATSLGDRVRVDVIDTGPGIPPGHEQEVFEPTVRLSTRAPGLGLGLATVKRLVEARGGSVGVESSWGHGSRFWFELPVVLERPRLVEAERSLLS